MERASKGKATEEDIKNKAKEIAEYEPVKPLRLFVDDVTSEKLTSVLAENNGCAAVVSAEGGIFDIISGLYSRNVNIDAFLKGHSGDTIRVDRIGRASESIIHPALTMVLAVQPEVLNGLMSNNTFRGRGLTARFLYSMPKSTVGSRSFSTEPIPEGVRVRYQDLIEAILSSDNEQQPISLDDGAGEVLETLFNEVEGRLKGDLAEIPDWAGKFVGSVLRISGILHVMKYDLHKYRHVHRHHGADKRRQYRRRAVQRYRRPTGFRPWRADVQGRNAASNCEVLKKSLYAMQARDRELDTLFERIYEDNVAGKLTDERFARMSAKYDAEQKELTGKIKATRDAIDKSAAKAVTTDMFISTVRKYTRARKLTSRMVNELIDYIEVHQAEKINGVWEQRLAIHYNCVGVIDIPETLPMPDITMNIRKGVFVNYAPSPAAT